MRSSRTESIAPTVAVLVAVIVTALLIYLPVAQVIVHMGDLSGIGGLLRRPYYRRIAGFSIYQALLSTVAAIALGLPGAYLLARFRFPGRSILRAAGTVPFVLPAVLVVLGFVLFWGNNGYVNRALGMLLKTDEPALRVLYSVRGIILAHAFYNFPICLRIVGARWEQLKPDQNYAARSLGASRARTFLTITVPRLLPSLAAAASLIFLFCFTSFAVILVLGGGPSTTTLEVEVYRLARMNIDLKTASQVAAVQAVMAISVILLYLAVQGTPTSLVGVPSNGDEGSSTTLRPSRWAVALGMGYAALLALLVAGPIIAVIVRSFLEPTSWAGTSRLTFRHYADLFAGGQSAEAIANSLLIGLAAALIATSLGSLFAWGASKSRGKLKDALELYAVLPLGISPVVLGLGYFYLGRRLGRLPDGIAIAFVHSMLGFPFVVRTLVSGFSSLPRETNWAARSLGAGRLVSFATVELPMVRAAVVAAASFAFALSMGELSAAIMLSSGRVVTIPVAMYRLVAAYRFTAACALGTFLMVLAFGVFFAFEGRQPRSAFT